MKVWVIGRSYPDRKNRMRGSFELDQARALAKRGCEVVYLACVFTPWRKIRNWGFARWEERGVHILTYSQPYPPYALHLYWQGLRERIWSRVLSRAEEAFGTPDLIHVHYPALLTEPLPVLAFQARGTKIVVTEHWTNVLTGKLDAHQKRQLKCYADSADIFLCVGTPLKESIERLTGTERKIRVLPNFYPDCFAPAEKKKGTFRFVTAGRLVPVKQTDRILRSFAAAFAGRTDAELTVIGGGREYGKLIRLARKLGIDGQVRFRGVLEREETAAAIAESDCLICFSRLETFGVPVIEAWACGLPVIASSAIGFAEDFDASLGDLIPCGDEESLRYKMKAVYENGSRFSKAQIRAFAEEHFSEEAVMGRLFRIYAEALEESRRRKTEG